MPVDIIFDCFSVLFAIARFILYLSNTAKTVCNDHPRDHKIVAVVDRWSLFRSHLCYKNSKWDPKKVVVEGSWLLFGGGL